MVRSPDTLTHNKTFVSIDSLGDLRFLYTPLSNIAHDLVITDRGLLGGLRNGPSGSPIRRELLKEWSSNRGGLKRE
jgi:hypothetical protein